MELLINSPKHGQKIVLLDDEDAAELILPSICIWRGVNRGISYYAIYHVPKQDKQIKLHRYLLGITDPSIRVDHINRNGLDNRRCNLRLATPSQNQHNKVAYRNNKSGYKGVSWHKGGRKWIAQIKCGEIHKYLGLYRSKEDAANAYNQAALWLHGEFAVLNSIK